MTDPIDEPDPDAPVELAITDVLDLHHFAPKQVPELVAAWLDECVARGFVEVRLIHGKGIGALRKTVHHVLERHPAVERFALADQTRGGWGATVVRLRAPKPE